MSVNERDKRYVITIAQDFQRLGFQVVATSGTAKVLALSGMEVETVYKVNEGRPNVVDLIKSKKIHLVVNTPLGRESFFDEKAIRAGMHPIRHPLHHHALGCGRGSERHPGIATGADPDQESPGVSRAPQESGRVPVPALIDPGWGRARGVWRGHSWRPLSSVG